MTSSRPTHVEQRVSNFIDYLIAWHDLIRVEGYVLRVHDTEAWPCLPLQALHEKQVLLLNFVQWRSWTNKFYHISKITVPQRTQRVHIMHR